MATAQEVRFLYRIINTRSINFILVKNKSDCSNFHGLILLPVGRYLKISYSESRKFLFNRFINTGDKWCIENLFLNWIIFDNETCLFSQ